MKTTSLIVLPLLLSAAWATGQTSSPASSGNQGSAAVAATVTRSNAPSRSAGEPAAKKAANSAELAKLLSQMNKSARGLNSVKADFQWDHYSKAAEQHSSQKGKVSFSRNTSGIGVSLMPDAPNSQQAALKDVDLRFYQTRIGSAEVKAISNPHVGVLIGLGFGTSGDSLAENFDLQLDGWETLDGLRTAKLELAPKTESAKPLFAHALLWVDPARNVALKQQFVQANGDYRTVHYTNLQVNEDLKSVLEQMDQAAASFKSASADFEWDQYQRVVDEHDVQKGTIYFRRSKGGIDAAVKIVSPEPKQVVFKEGKLSLYQPKIDQVTEYKAGGNRADVESFMSLGFGASGAELARNFAIKLDGWETVDGIKTAKLDLTPKQEKVKSSLSHVLLWIDPKRNVSLKQQFFEPSGDYRLAHYEIKGVNSKISDDVFRLKTTSRTKVVHAQ